MHRIFIISISLKFTFEINQYSRLSAESKKPRVLNPFFAKQKTHYSSSFNFRFFLFLFLSFPLVKRESRSPQVWVYRERCVWLWVYGDLSSEFYTDSSAIPTVARARTLDKDIIEGGPADYAPRIFTDNNKTFYEKAGKLNFRISFFTTVVAYRNRARFSDFILLTFLLYTADEVYL